MASVRTFKLPHYETYPIQIALFKDVQNASFLRSQLLEANPDFDYAFLDAEMVRSPIVKVFHYPIQCDSDNWSGLQASRDIYIDYRIITVHSHIKQILSPTHLLTATFLALHAILTSRQKTRTPHSELVFRLSPNNNIGESYKKFGLSDSTTHLIAVKLPLKPVNSSGGTASLEAQAQWTLDEMITRESVSKHLGRVVKGTSAEVSEKGEELGDGCDVEKVRKIYKLGGGNMQKGKKGAVVNGDAADERRAMESVIVGTMALKGS